MLSDADIIAVAQRVRHRYPIENGRATGYCGHISPEIAKTLRSMGLKARSKRGHVAFPNANGGGRGHFTTHWWVEIGDRVLDATADQFCNCNRNGVADLPPIVYLTKREARTGVSGIQWYYRGHCLSGPMELTDAQRQALEHEFKRQYGDNYNSL